MYIFIAIPFLFCIAFSSLQAQSDTVHKKFNTYEELEQMKDSAQIDVLTYIDSTLGYSVVFPDWLTLQETGTPKFMGGTLPAVRGIENAIVIKGFYKSEFPSFDDFKDYVILGSTVGSPPQWNDEMTFMGMTSLGTFEEIGPSYKTYLMWKGKMYHCQYVLAETSGGYLWIDFTATEETYNTNLVKLREFLSTFALIE